MEQPVAYFRSDFDLSLILWRRPEDASNVWKTVINEILAG